MRVEIHPGGSKTKLLHIGCASDAEQDVVGLNLAFYPPIDDMQNPDAPVAPRADDRGVEANLDAVAGQGTIQDLRCVAFLAGRNFGSFCTIVTCEPILQKACASSHPSGPPPMTARRLGKAVISKIVALV